MTTLKPPALTPFRLEGDFVSQLLTNIRTRSISWTSFVKANYLSSENMAVLKAVTSVNDQEDPSSSVDVLIKDLPTYSRVLLDSITAISKNKSKYLDLTKILLVILYDGLTYIDNSVPEHTMTYEIMKISKNNPYPPFVEILESSSSNEQDSNQDEFIISILCAHILTFFLTTNPPSSEKEASKLVSTVLKFIQDKLVTSSNTQYRFLGVQLLKEILSVKEFREIYLKKPEYLDALIKIMLEKNIELQMRYLSIYCLWTLTFDPKTNHLLTTDAKYSEIIPTMFKFSNDAVKEKVVRLSISILINFLDISGSPSSKSQTEIIKKFLLANGLTIVKNLIERKWSDNELKDDLNTLYDLLNDSIKSLTNFDEYENEIKTKHLLWSPCHKNSEFWYDNIDKFKENNWKLLKSLIALLSDDNSAPDANVNQLYINQSIICYDLSMLIKVAPEVVKVINSLGTKTKIMALMNSPNSNVKFEALRTTQLLVANSL